jgi:hypothetical protein
MYDDILGKKTEKTSEKVKMVQCKVCNRYFALIIEGQQCPYCSQDVITGYIYTPYIPLSIFKFEYAKECPKCGSENIEAVETFDYVKQCKDCGHQFVTGEHN